MTYTYAYSMFDFLLRLVNDTVYVWQAKDCDVSQDYDVLEQYKGCKLQLLANTEAAKGVGFNP